MSNLVATAMRLAAQLVHGQLAETRARLLRSLVVLSITMVLLAVALAMAVAVLAVALADRIGMVPALLSIGAVATIAALILMLTLRTRSARSTTNGLDLLSLTVRELPRIDPLMVVVAALAVGLLLGRRRK
jgi:uncharacterized membrane protein YqjE